MLGRHLDSTFVCKVLSVHLPVDLAAAALRLCVRPFESSILTPVMIAELAVIFLIVIAAVQFFRDASNGLAVDQNRKGRRGSGLGKKLKKSPAPYGLAHCDLVKRRLSPIFEGPYGDEGTPKFNVTLKEKDSGSYQPYVSGRRASVMAACLSDH